MPRKKVLFRTWEKNQTSAECGSWCVSWVATARTMGTSTSLLMGWGQLTPWRVQGFKNSTPRGEWSAPGAQESSTGGGGLGSPCDFMSPAALGAPPAPALGSTATLNAGGSPVCLFKASPSQLFPRRGWQRQGQEPGAGNSPLQAWLPKAAQQLRLKGVPFLGQGGSSLGSSRHGGKNQDQDWHPDPVEV